MTFYLDQNLPPRIAEMLRARGLDAVSAHEVPDDFAAIADAVEQVARDYPGGVANAIVFLASAQPRQ